MKDTKQKRSTVYPRGVWCGVLLLHVLGASMVSGAGANLQFETTVHGQGDPVVQTSTMKVEGRRLKMVIRQAGDEAASHATIFSGGESPRIVVINHRDKTFLTMDPESITALGNEMQEAMQETRQQLANLSPEQRAVVEKLLDSQLNRATKEKLELPVNTVLRTEERETHHGFPCVRYDVFREGEKIREVWVTPWEGVDGSRQAFDVLRSMTDFYGELMATFEKKAQASFGGGFGLDQHPFDDLQHMDGFPVVTRNFSGGSLATEVALHAFEQQNHEAAEFEPPAGYRPTALTPR